MNLAEMREKKIEIERERGGEEVEKEKLINCQSMIKRLNYLE